MLGISAGMEQKDSYVACLRPRSSSFSAAACTWLVLWVTIFHAVVVDMLVMLGILTGMDQKDSTSLVVLFGLCKADALVTLQPTLCSLDCRPSSSRMVAVHGWFCR